MPEQTPKEKRRRPPAKKKTVRACNHCHKAHMTCDDTRPCQRCFQRGLQDTCVDAPRKKKKYLMDVPEELSDMTRSASVHSNSSNSPSASSTVPAALPSLADQGLKTEQQHHAVLNDLYPPQLSFQRQSQQSPQHYVPSLQGNNKRSKFMSNAANSEYSILSDIIKQDDFIISASAPQTSSYSDISTPQIDSNIYHQRRDSSHLSNGSTPTPQGSVYNDLYSSYGKGDKSINQYMLGFVQDKIVTLPEALKSIEGEKQFQGDLTDDTNAVLSFSIAINEAVENGTTTSTSSSQSVWGLRFKESEDIYAKVNQPFSYTPGFHALIQYLKTRFARNELIQMAKAMASYRPSFIACTNTLKEEDLIFMEQCFQRTLLEYDKFISISGTPTIVWRRTGQIAYVSEEFCILTGWTKEQLLNKITFIVELMDDSSVLEYFNLFSTIAYGDFRGATMGGCTLLTPESSTVKTTCMWTLKRDVFGIPMMIIGNFLPIL